MKAADVQLGTMVEFAGFDWQVWSKGPDWGGPACYWLIRYDEDGKVIKEVAKAKDLFRGPRLRGAG